jgi:cysteinyl-tRNA synthetase
MDDDFNTAQALAIMFDLAREINRAREAGYTVVSGQQLMLLLADTLGLTFQYSWSRPLDTKLITQIRMVVHQELNQTSSLEEKVEAEEIIEDLIRLRNELRKSKQWQNADMIRDKLVQAGVVLEDTPKGTVWKRRR